MTAPPTSAVCSGNAAAGCTNALVPTSLAGGQERRGDDVWVESFTHPNDIRTEEASARRARWQRFDGRHIDRVIPRTPTAVSGAAISVEGSVYRDRESHVGGTIGLCVRHCTSRPVMKAIDVLRHERGPPRTRQREAG